VAVVVVVAAPIDVHVLAAVVGVGAAAEAGRSGVAEAESVGGQVELGVGMGGRGGGYSHGLVGGFGWFWGGLRAGDVFGSWAGFDLVWSGWFGLVDESVQRFLLFALRFEVAE